MKIVTKKCPHCGSYDIEEADLFWEDSNPDLGIVCAEAFCVDCEESFVVRYKVELLDCKECE